jgi:geranylgeranyl diphosphate synthase type I
MRLNPLGGEHIMTTHSQARRTAGPAELRNALVARVESRIGELLTEEYRHWADAEPRAAGLVSDLAALVRGDSSRIRSVLCLTGYLAAGGDPQAPQAVDASASLEFLDAVHLIRSDTREGAALRRGLPTLPVLHAAEHERNGWRGESRRFGEGTAVLAGDLALAYAERLASRLPSGARRVWDALRTDRVLGAYAQAAAAAEYQDDPWPGGCIAECPCSCGAGWYAVAQPLQLGAALAGRRDLVTVYRDYGQAVHAAWRLRGFLDGGQGFGEEAELLREVLLDQRGRDSAERLIVDLVARASRTVRVAPVAHDWRAELAACAQQLAGPAAA